MIMTDFWLDEFRDLDLPDERVNKRVISLLCAMNGSPGASISQLGTSKKETKAAYRLLDNDNFDVKTLMTLHYEQTAQRCKEHEIVVLVQDTTGLNFNHKSVKGMGRIGGKIGRNKVESNGLYCHNLLAFSLAGEPLGLFDQKIWARSKKLLNPDVAPSKRESYKWISSLDKEEFLDKADTKFIVISDRESDAGAYIKVMMDRGYNFIIRARSARKDYITQKSLQRCQSEAKPCAEISVAIENRTLTNSHRRKPQKIRYSKDEQDTDFKLTFFDAEVALHSKTDDRTAKVKIVNISEVSPRRGTNPISWTLMTNLKVEDVESAKKILEFYKSRWRIEVYHKAQKSSCQIERSGLRTKERLERYIALKSLISFGVCRLRYLLEAHPEEPAEKFFHSESIKILHTLAIQKAKQKGKKIRVQDFIFMLANLDGYTTFKLDRPPGVIKLANAIRIFNLSLQAYEIGLKRKDVGKR